MSQKWKNYILANKINNKTYIGSTVNINRRIRQHNSEIKNGAKYTKCLTSWMYYCVIYSMENYTNKRKCLSIEWHLKYKSRKENGSSYEKRNKGIIKLLNEKILNESELRYNYIIFVSKDFLHLIKQIMDFNEKIFIIIVKSKNINEEYINYWLNIVDSINNMQF